MTSRKFVNPRRLWLLFAAVLFVVCACLQQREVPAPPVEMPPPPAPPPPPKPEYITLVAVGDNLYHETLINSSQSGDGYDFRPLYGEIREIIQAADIAFVNQETVFGGKKLGFSGYPQFNTPTEVGDALADAGFDIACHANNHIMDKGEAAVFATMDYWDTVPGVAYLGIHRSAESRAAPWLILEKKGVKIGFLAYTFSTNGIPVPKDKPYLVSLLNRDIMDREISALRPLCDFLVVSMHWGEEYQHTQNKWQEDLAAFLARLEVDLIIGHHPHVVQPCVWLDRPGGKKTLCFYSLGNFISGQIRTETLLGALMYLRLKKAAGEISIAEAGVLPIITHYETGPRGSQGYRVYPLYTYTEELAARHRRRAFDKDVTLKHFDAVARQVFDAGQIIIKNPFVWGENQFENEAILKEDE